MISLSTGLESDELEKVRNDPTKDPNKSSPMSSVSENQTLRSPAVGSLSSPRSTLDNEFKRQQSIFCGELKNNSMLPFGQSTKESTIFYSDTVGSFIRIINCPKKACCY